jgi:hypothetical protein
LVGINFTAGGAASNERTWEAGTAIGIATSLDDRTSVAMRLSGKLLRSAPRAKSVLPHRPRRNNTGLETRIVMRWTSKRSPGVFPGLKPSRSFAHVTAQIKKRLTA